LTKIVLFFVPCFNKGFFFTFGKFYFKLSSANRNKYLRQLHYVHSQLTNRGSKRISYFLVVDENEFELFLLDG